MFAVQEVENGHDAAFNHLVRALIANVVGEGGDVDAPPHFTVVGHEDEPLFGPRDRDIDETGVVREAESPASVARLVEDRAEDHRASAPALEFVNGF